MRRRFRNTVVLILSVYIMLASVATHAQDMPREVRRDYPEEQFIVRQGTGETAESAAEAARLEIAKYFEAKISGETVVREWAQSQSTKGKLTEEHFTELTNDIMVSASRDIPGIEIALTERDGRDGNWSAWAALDRASHARLLRERIDDADRQVNLQLNQLAPGDLNLLRTLGQVLSRLLDREKDRSDLVLLESGGVPPTDQELLFTVMSGLDSLIAEAFDVAVVFEGTVDPEVRAGMIQSITGAGIRVRQFPDIEAAAGAGTDLAITVSQTITPRVASQTVNGREFTFYFSDWVLSVGTMIPETSEILATTVLTGETNGSYESQARERMIRRILDVQVPEISAWVYDTIFKPQS